MKKETNSPGHLWKKEMLREQEIGWGRSVLAQARTTKRNSLFENYVGRKNPFRMQNTLNSIKHRQFAIKYLFDPKPQIPAT